MLYSKRNKFINSANNVHNGYYDYSKVEYKNAHTKVCIICPEHGEFWQTPNHHIMGSGCPKCCGRKYTLEDFLTESRKVHGDKYDYSKVVFVNKTTKVCIICPEHGEFWQTPTKHINGQQGCPKCNYGGKSKHEKFIEKAKMIHGDKYDYSKVKYINCNTRVCIICPEHGEFWQTPTKHLIGRGCKLCGESKRHISLCDFIDRSNKIHNYKYDYSLAKETKYVNEKVCIICPEHGEFWQTINSHLNGHGCPLCNESKLEKNVESFLKSININFEREKCFNWLILDSYQRLDFYLRDYNIAIECQGVQHFKPIEYWGGNSGLKKQKWYDENKKKLCERHNIKIIYYNYNEKFETIKEKIKLYLNDTTCSKTSKNE